MFSMIKNFWDSSIELFSFVLSDGVKEVRECKTLIGGMFCLMLGFAALLSIFISGIFVILCIIYLLTEFLIIAVPIITVFGVATWLIRRKPNM